MKEVLIVGAGPTGLMLAVQLARRGVSGRLIDKNGEAAHESRALVLQARSFEILQNLGLEEEVLRAGTPARDVTLFVEGKPRAHLDIRETEIGDTPYPFVFFISQAETEKILARAAEKLGVTVERRVELLDFKDLGDGVRTRIRESDGRVSDDLYKFVVGCDGAHSVVRHVLDLAFPGAPYAQTFVLADCKLQGLETWSGLKIFLGKLGLMVVFPLKEGLHRVIASGPPSLMPPAEHERPDLTKIEALARKISQQEIRLTESIWLTGFRLHHRGVDRFRKGRGFVAGDAAHIHSPAGGQGMNTGLQDATNLAWKLAMTLKGEGSEALLDTYHAERRPVSQHLLRSTDRLFMAASSSHRLSLRLRNFLAPMAAWVILKSPLKNTLRTKFFRFISQLAVRYRHGALYEFAREHRADHGWAGVRMPEIKMAQDTLFKRLKESDAYKLIWFTNSSKMDAEIPEMILPESVRRSCPILLLNKDYMPREMKVNGDAAFVLVRPDGYVALFDGKPLGQRISAYFKKFHGHSI